MQATQRYQVRRNIIADTEVELEIKLAALTLMEALNWKRNQHSLDNGPEEWVKSLTKIYPVPLEDLKEAFVWLMEKGWMKIAMNEEGKALFVLGEIDDFPRHDFDQ